MKPKIMLLSALLALSLPFNAAIADECPELSGTYSCGPNNRTVMTKLEAKNKLFSILSYRTDAPDDDRYRSLQTIVEKGPLSDLMGTPGYCYEGNALRIDKEITGRAPNDWQETIILRVRYSLDQNNDLVVYNYDGVTAKTKTCPRVQE